MRCDFFIGKAADKNIVPQKNAPFFVMGQGLYWGKPAPCGAAGSRICNFFEIVCRRGIVSRGGRGDHPIRPSRRAMPCLIMRLYFL